MTEAVAEMRNAEQHKVADALGISEQTNGHAIGILVLCGQGPVQDRRTKVKLESLGALGQGLVKGAEANVWMRFIARAAGVLDREGDVGLIIPSGRATGGSYVDRGVTVAPTEAALMEDIIETVYGQQSPQGGGRVTRAEIEREEEAKNTLFNVIRAANIIDRRRADQPDNLDLDNVWFVGAHFHKPRIRILATLFGFDPKKFLSAEEVLMTASKIEEGRVEARAGQEGGAFDPHGFNKQRALQNLIHARLSDMPIDAAGLTYFERKKMRAEGLLDQVLAANVAPERRAEVKQRIYIEEQKDAQMRMRGERRWVRGLATQIDYVLPLAGNLTSDERLRTFLLHFSARDLATYDIDRAALETTTSQTLPDIMREVRTKIDPGRWSWQVVKAEWENETYPESVKSRFRDLGIPEDEIENLSEATVPTLNEHVT